MSEKHWDPAALLEQGSKDAHALIVLNQPVSSLSLLRTLWSSAKYILLADGGANRVYDFLDEGERLKLLPTAIHGDLDSLRPDVRKFYEAHNIPVLLDEDQYSTDFTKCIKLAVKLHTESSPPPNSSTSLSNPPIPNPPLSIVALGGLSGRVDQALSQLHELFSQSSHPLPGTTGSILLVTPQNISFVLTKGTHRIRAPRDILGPSVGIVPLTGPKVISTKGLRWDVTNWKTVIGEKVSTSNYLAETGEERVWVECDGEVLFTIEIRGEGG